MFLPYSITSYEITRIIDNQNNKLDFEDDYSDIREEIGKHITAQMIEDKLLNGTMLQETWFPTNQHFDIFLSHSHKDETLVKKFAAYLRDKFKARVFIDSCYWGFCDELLRGLDNRICHYTDNEGKGWYSYDRRNFTTSLVHIILANALLQMMKNTETIIFIDSKNSLVYNKDKDKSKTPSAWIYQEISYANSLENVVPERWVEKLRLINKHRKGGMLQLFCESQMPEIPETNFDVDLSEFFPLTAYFLENMQYCENADDMMNILHIEYLKTIASKFKKKQHPLLEERSFLLQKNFTELK